MPTTLIIDLDDTLASCHKEYADVLTKGSLFVKKHTGLDAPVARKLISQIDLLALEHSPCFSKARFPRSFVAALAAAGELMSTPICAEQLQAIEHIGESVFTAKYPLFRGVRKALEQLKADGHVLVLYTMGDPAVQQRKITNNKLEQYFSVIEIVDAKTTAALKALWTKLGKPDDVLCVGDSLRNDIAPAKALGFRTAHIQHLDAWSFTHVDGVEPDYIMRRFEEVIDYAEA